MIKLSKLITIINEAAPQMPASNLPPVTASPQDNNNVGGNFYDWTKEFDTFKTTINAATEEAKTKFEKSLSSKFLNKSVKVRASKAQPKQPVKDYEIKRVTNVSIVDYYDDWTVVLKNEFNKEYCLTPGYKIKVLGASTPEVGNTNTPQSPEQPTPPVASPQPEPQKPVGNGQQPHEQPIKEDAKTSNFQTLGTALEAVEEYVVQNGVQLDPSEHPTDAADPYGVREPFMYGGISYNTQKKADYKLFLFKNKPTKKYLHVVIYRLDSGLYELNQYVL